MGAQRSVPMTAGIRRSTGLDHDGRAAVYDILQGVDDSGGHAIERDGPATVETQHNATAAFGNSETPVGLEGKEIVQIHIAVQVDVDYVGEDELLAARRVEIKNAIGRRSLAKPGRH